MKENLFLPEKIKVGYQERHDTYTKKLAYVIYYDNEGILRKEKSWEQWRDDSITPDEFENKPMEGFVLNKSVGGKGGGWDNRQAYIRIYDPRGFEFEITLENLLFILEHNSCIKGKGLEGEYVYVWNNTELFLMPTNADIYTKVLEYNDTLKNAKPIDTKDLQVGFTYLTKKNEKFVYLGKHVKYDYSNQSLGDYFWFAYVFDSGYFYIQNFKNVKNKFIKIHSTTLPSNYVDMEKELKKDDDYKLKKLDFTYEEITETLEDIKKRIRTDSVIIFYEDRYRSIWRDKRYNYDEGHYDEWYCLEGKNKKFEDFDVFKDCKFYIKKYKTK